MTTTNIAQALVDVCAEPGFQVICIAHDWFQPHECIETKQAIAEEFEFVQEWEDKDGHHWAVVKARGNPRG